MARFVVYAAALIWLACVGVSLLSLNAPPEGDSFLRGFNRIEGFLTWQLAALGAAVAGTVALRAVAPPRPRLVALAGYVPVALSALLVVALVAIVAWAAFAPSPPVDPSTVQPPAPVTEPG
jgi:hypothetical protein